MSAKMHLLFKLVVFCALVTFLVIVYVSVLFQRQGLPDLDGTEKSGVTVNKEESPQLKLLREFIRKYSRRKNQSSEFTYKTQQLYEIRSTKDSRSSIIHTGTNPEVFPGNRSTNLKTLSESGVHKSSLTLPGGNSNNYNNSSIFLHQLDEIDDQYSISPHDKQDINKMKEKITSASQSTLKTDLKTNTSLKYLSKTSHIVTIKQNVNFTAGKQLVCPSTNVVTVEDGGRLGNKIFEYAAVWGMGKMFNLEPYVPRSLLEFLRQVFENLSVPPLEIPNYCNVTFGPPIKRWLLYPVKYIRKKYPDNILLHKWIVFPEAVLPYMHELKNEFRFHQKYLDAVTETFKRIEDERRVNRTRRSEKLQFVGVHVRRTDFKAWLPRVYNRTLVGAEYFLDAMQYFRNKYSYVSFLVTSDDMDWCKNNLISSDNDIFFVSHGGLSHPGYDLALLSFCNHSIIDYGTFGLWAALMAGGETFCLSVDPYLDQALGTLRDWHIIKDKDVRKQVSSTRRNSPVSLRDRKLLVFNGFT